MKINLPENLNLQLLPPTKINILEKIIFYILYGNFVL